MLPLRSISMSSLRVLKHCMPSSLGGAMNSSLTVFRPISTTSVKLVKEIKIQEDGDQIVVEAVPIESDRKDYLVQLSPSQQQQQQHEHASHQYCDACPLCRLNLKRLQYFDVLILHQFVESNGVLMPREMTGLCHRSYAQVKKLVGQAQKARLLPRPPNYESSGPWDDLNRYYEYPRRHRDQPMKVIKKEYWEGSQ